MAAAAVRLRRTETVVATAVRQPGDAVKSHEEHPFFDADTRLFLGNNKPLGVDKTLCDNLCGVGKKGSARHWAWTRRGTTRCGRAAALWLAAPWRAHCAAHSGVVGDGQGTI